MRFLLKQDPFTVLAVILVLHPKWSPKWQKYIATLNDTKWQKYSNTHKYVEATSPPPAVRLQTSYLFLIYILSGSHTTGKYHTVWHTPNLQICGPVSSFTLKYIRGTKIDNSVEAAARARARERYQNTIEPKNMWNQQRQQRLTPSPAVRRNVGAGGGTMVTPSIYSSTLPHSIKRYNTVGARFYLAHNEAQRLPLCIWFSSQSILLYKRVRAHAMLSLSLLHHTLVTLQHCSTKICCCYTYLNYHKTPGTGRCPPANQN